MKLKSLNKFISFLILFISFQSLYAEEQIDIWNKEIQEKSETVKPDNDISNNTINSEIFKKSQTLSIVVFGFRHKSSKNIK